MAWQDEIPLMIRYAVGDVDAPQTYSDSRLETQAVVAAFHVKSEISLPTSYTISVPATGISPDPTNTSTKDDAFVSLIVLKSACMLATNESRIRGGQSISIKDGDSSISTTDRAKVSQEIANSFCKAYEDAKWEYQTGQFAAASARVKFITSPFRFQQGGNEGWWGG